MANGSTDSQNFAERYQSVLVPVIFEPWARELIDRAALQGGEHVLDLACGTGVVTREIAKSGLSTGSLAAVDHNGDMLSVARELAARLGQTAEWVEADAGDLPFESDRFDVAFCQQALQFFPDRPAALRELRRVMKSGGKVIFCLTEGIVRQSTAQVAGGSAGQACGSAGRGGRTRDLQPAGRGRDSRAF